MSTIGECVSGPVGMVSWMPFSTAGMNCFGTLPPTTCSRKATPTPHETGCSSITTWANWPWPPDCFLWQYSDFAGALMVSR